MDILETVLLGIQDKEVPVYLIPADFVGELSIPVEADPKVTAKDTTATFAFDDVYGVMLLDDIAVIWTTWCEVHTDNRVEQKTWAPPDYFEFKDVIRPKADVDFEVRESSFWCGEYVKVSAELLEAKKTLAETQEKLVLVEKDRGYFRGIIHKIRLELTKAKQDRFRYGQALVKKCLEFDQKEV